MGVFYFFYIMAFFSIIAYIFIYISTYLTNFTKVTSIYKHFSDSKSIPGGLIIAKEINYAQLIYSYVNQSYGETGLIDHYLSLLKSYENFVTVDLVQTDFSIIENKEFHNYIDKINS